MKVLLFAAHGSRKENSNLEISVFFEKVADKLKDKIDRSVCCFLQFGTPGIEEAITDQIENGATEIYIFPYFLFNGSHVTVDIPLIQEKFKEKYPGLEIEVLDALADADGFDFFISDYLGKKLN